VYWLIIRNIDFVHVNIFNFNKKIIYF
jgi:hypothetical protein